MSTTDKAARSWRKFKAGDVAPFFPHGQRVEVVTEDGRKLELPPDLVNWGHDSSVVKFRILDAAK